MHGGSIASHFYIYKLPINRLSGRYVTIACHQQSQITSLHQRSLIAHANRCRFEADPPTL